MSPESVMKHGSAALNPDTVDMNRFMKKGAHRHEAGIGGYLSGPPIVDEVEPDGTIRGHYGPTIPNDGRCIWCGAIPAEGESWSAAAHNWIEAAQSAFAAALGVSTDVLNDQKRRRARLKGLTPTDGCDQYPPRYHPHGELVGSGTCPTADGLYEEPRTGVRAIEFSNCPICDNGAVVRLPDDWQEQEDRKIPIIACGNPWHYATASLAEARAIPPVLDEELLAKAIYLHREQSNAKSQGCDHNCALEISEMFARLHEGDSDHEVKHEHR